MISPVCRRCTDFNLVENIRRSPLRRVLAGLLAGMLLLSPYGVLAAPVPDIGAPTSKQPAVYTQNGIPVVQIAAPNSSGVSHNKFQSFDVGWQGVVLNNATKPVENTLAGTVSANPNFSGKAAGVILNEVSKGYPSLLQGPLEVAGTSAKVILANPNGITCDGCSFINTPHIQLTTGQPQWKNGALNFDVVGGTIWIGVDGLTALASRIDLISSNIVVEGPVAARELNFQAGHSYVDAETLIPTIDEQHRSVSPAEELPDGAYLIDVSQSLTAGTIRLVVTRDLFFGGVRAIRATDLVQAEQDIVVYGRGRVDIDDLRAGGNISVFSPTAVSLKGVSAGQNLQLVASKIDATYGALWSAGNDIQLGTANNSDHWGDFKNYGVIDAKRDIIVAFGPFGATAKNYGSIHAGRDIVGLTPPSATETEYSYAQFFLEPTIQRFNEASEFGNQWKYTWPTAPLIQGYGHFNNEKYGGGWVGSISADRNISLLYGYNSLSTGIGGTLTALGNIDLWNVVSPDANSINQPASYIAAGQDIWLHDLPVSCDPSRCGGGSATVNASNAHLIAGRDVHIEPTQNQVNPTWDFVNIFQISADRNIIVRTDAGFVNAGRDMKALGSIDIQSERFSNTAWITTQSGFSSYSNSPSPTSHPGCNTSYGAVCTYTDEILRTTGSLNAVGDISVTAKKFTNLGASIIAGGNIDVFTDSFSNEKQRVLVSKWSSTYGSGAAKTTETGTSELSTIDSIIRAGGHFLVTGRNSGGANGNTGASGSGDANNTGTGTSASSFINTGKIEAATVLIKAEEVRNGYDPKSDYYQNTVLPEGNQLSSETSIDRGQILAATRLQIEGAHVLNMGYLDSAGTVAIVTEGQEGASTDGSTSTSSFINTGKVTADSVLIKAEEVRNGYDPKEDHDRKTVSPEGNPFSFDSLADGGQLLAGSLLQLEGKDVLNTGYLGSGGVLAIQADALKNVKRSADYAEDRPVDGGTLHIRGDTVQAGGAIAASEWILDVGSLYSRSGDFVVLRGTETESQSASEALLANLSNVLGANYTYEKAQDNLTSTFEARKKKKKGWGGLAGLIVGFVVSYFTFGVASPLIGEAAASGSTWAAGGLANTVASQGIASFAGSVAGQYAASGDVNWQSALTAGLTAGITAGLTNAGVFSGDKSLNQLAGVNNVGGVVTNVGAHNLDGFATNLLGMAGRGVVTAGVSTAINGGSFEKAFINSVVSDLGAVGANAVGQTTDQLSVANLLGHALVGCSVSAGQGKDCAAGAVGGVTGAVVNPLLGTLTEGSSTTERTIVHTMTSMLVSGGLADALGLDSTTAASAALNETLNNYLSPKGVDTIKKACAGARDPKACQLRLAADFNQNTDQKIANCRAQGNCRDLLNEVSTGFDAIKAAQADGTLTPAAAAILLEKQTRDMESLLAAMNQPLPDKTALRALVAVGLGGAAVLACLADGPGCAVLIYKVATSPTTVAVAEATLCMAAGAMCPMSVTGVGVTGGVRAGASGIGPWGKGVTNIVEGGTFTQCGNGSCVSATAQVLTGGKVTEAQALAKLGEWAEPTKLSAVLNELAPSSVPWKGTYFASGSDALAVASKGPMGAVLQAPGEGAHMVTISPIGDSPGIFRVQDTGVGKTYDVTASWIKQYVSAGVWK